MGVTGKLRLPGGVDVQIHLDSSMTGAATSEDFVIGTRAAACDTTTLVDFAMQPAGKPLLGSLSGHRAGAEDKAVIDYSFHMCITDLYDGAVDEFAGIVRTQ